MGAWGRHALENDTALDWVVELAESDDLAPVEAALPGPGATGSAFCVAMAVAL